MDPVREADDYAAVTAELLRRTVEELQHERDALRGELHRAGERIRDLTAQLRSTEQVCLRLDAERRALDGQLTAIRSGLGWAVLERFQQFRDRLLPEGSAAHRAYTRLARTLARRLGSPDQPVR